MRQVRDDPIATRLLQQFPLANAVRRPGYDPDSAVVKGSDHVRVDVVVAGKAPPGAEARGVAGEADDGSAGCDPEIEIDATAMQFGDDSVIERRHNHVRPTTDLTEQRVLPVAALHFEDHRAAVRVPAKIGERLQDPARRGEL